MDILIPPILRTALPECGTKIEPDDGDPLTGLAPTQTPIVALDPPSDAPGEPSPTAALLDLLGRRWALRILWELRDGPCSFNGLRSRCDGMSGSVLSQRLSELRDARLIEPESEGGYRLTEAAASLLTRMRFFDDWASEWSKVWTSASRSRSGR
jgi:DNA-binding HxlR family transcriptional regulator